MNECVNLTGYLKGEERYLWFWLDGQEEDVLRSVGRLAANADVAFSWLDAVKVVKRIRHPEVDQ